jgi:hypothetical protein
MVHVGVRNQNEFYPVRFVQIQIPVAFFDFIVSLVHPAVNGESTSCRLDNVAGTRNRPCRAHKFNFHNRLALLFTEIHLSRERNAYRERHLSYLVENRNYPLPPFPGGISIECYNSLMTLVKTESGTIKKAAKCGLTKTAAGSIQPRASRCDRCSERSRENCGTGLEMMYLTFFTAATVK